ncbi:MAG: hypothetical protein LBM61_04690 [Prevotellaceae bacterium]|nr:hypothetical protein [Prevotellaceae bacterium]
MKRHRLLVKNCLWLFLLLPLIGGCEKGFKAYEKILDTATINGRNYQNSTWWAWNFQRYPMPIELHEIYKIFHYIAQLSPTEGDAPSYNIEFYIYANNAQFKTGNPYLIDIYENETIASSFWIDNIKYISSNASEIFVGNIEGVAYATSSVSENFIPLKGELVLESIDPETEVCHGYYSLSSPENAPDKLVINGKFETKTSINKFDF